MALITVKNARWGIDAPPLIDGVDLQIEKGERIGLIGRNGVGKTTLFRLITGEIRPDAGESIRQQGIVVSAMDQDVPEAFAGTVFDVTASAFGQKGRDLAEHRKIAGASQKDRTGPSNGKPERLQHRLNKEDAWELLPEIDSILSRIGLDPDARFKNLSAGVKRRTLFAKALVTNPDLLLLDEPTNHLDIDTIVWMEDFILRHVKTLLFITHDREFLKRIATRIMELDRGRIYSHQCNYETFMERRRADLEAEEKQNARFDKTLSQEEAWIRQGVKARRTRNEGRVRKLKEMREERRRRRQQPGNASMRLQQSEKSGKIVIEAKNVSFSYEGKRIIDRFSTTVMRGDKLGVIGPNGVGKTTLLKILLKEIAPSEGEVRHGADLTPVYFDQLRTALDEEKTVQENIADGNDFLTINGQRRHVISYLKDFLFTPERCRTPVYILSGGEKNRLLLARLFVKPSNLLILDEPTNDLDAETLELLEELLFDFPHTILLVSHDRAFLNNVVTGTIAFDDKGGLTEYAGGYDDWLIQRPEPQSPPVPEKKASAKKSRKPESKKPRKLSFKETLELRDLPGKIEVLESERETLAAAMADPKFYKTEKTEIAAVKERFEGLEQEIETAYGRWEALETIREGESSG